jgi:hypothetical protein
MSGKAFVWFLLNMTLIYLFGELAGAGVLHGWALPVGIIMGAMSYQFGKRMIRAGMMS